MLPKVQLTCSSLKEARALNAATGPLPTGGRGGGRDSIYLLRYTWVFFAKVVLVPFQKGGDMPMDEGKFL